MSWRRLEVLVEGLARTPGTLLHRKLTGDDWSRAEHLLAAAVDVLNAANWQRSGGKGSRPKPISPSARENRQERVGNAAQRSPQQVAMVLALYRSGAFDSGG